MHKKIKKRLFFLLRLILSISIISLLIIKVGVNELISTILNFEPSLLLIIMLVYPIFFVSNAYNFKLLSLLPGRKISFKKIFQYANLSWAYGLFVPGKLGEFSLIYFMKKEGYDIGESTAIAITDKIITLLVLIFLSVYGLFKFLGLKSSLIITTSILFLIMIGSAVFLSNFGRNLLKKILGRFSKFFKGFSKTVFFYMKKRKAHLFLNFLNTFVKWIVVAFLYYMIFNSFKEYIPFLIVLSVTAATIIVSLIPITISGIGLKESFAVLAYSYYNVRPEIVLSAYLLLLLVGYIFALIFVLGVKTDKK